MDRRYDVEGTLFYAVLPLIVPQGGPYEFGEREAEGVVLTKRVGPPSMHKQARAQRAAGF